MINKSEAPNYRENKLHEPLVVERESRRLAIVAFTDLDGTANDETKPESERLNTIAPAKEAISALEQKGIPVGITTGRSFGEAVLYQNKLGSHGPIICEDGAVVVLPEGYSKESVLGVIPEAHQVVVHERRIAVVLSKISRSKLEEFLNFSQSEMDRLGLSSNKPVVSTLFNSPEEIQRIIGHPTTNAARLSMDRIASAYIPQASHDQIDYIRTLATSWGIRTFGIPLHLIGEDADKGHALQLINKYANIFFPRQEKSITGILPITFGNNTNDLRLAEEAKEIGGISVLVGRPGGGYFVPETDIPQSVIKTKEAYGKGILAAIPEILSRLKNSYNIEI